MLVANPPWKLAEQLGDALPWLAAALATGGGGSYRTEAG
jgi:23S rRNA A2030 N6-methylase RlmJ